MKKTKEEMTEMELYTYQQKEKYDAMMNEEYQVILKLPSAAHNWRITYSNKKSNKILAIEEVTPEEEVLSLSIFRGKSCSGFCSADIKDMKPILSIKPIYWLFQNPELWVDEYFKRH